MVTQPTRGRVQGFTAVCTHQGCLVSSVSDGTINCACHGSKYSIEDGDVESGPATLRARRGRRSPSRATRSAWRRRAAGRDRASVVARRVPPVEPARRAPRRASSSRSARTQRRDPGLLDDLALGVRAAEPPDCGPRARRARRRPPSTARRPVSRSARASGATTSRWVGCAWRAAQPASRSRPAASSERQQRDRGVHARGTASPGRSSDVRGRPRAATCSSPGTSAASGVSAQRNSSEPVSTSARQPSPCSGRSWRRTGAGRRRGRRARARAARRARRSG